MSQTTDDLIASIVHVFLQIDREKAAHLAKIEALTQACDVQAGELATMRQLARDVCERAERDDNNVTPDTATALRKLEKVL